MSSPDLRRDVTESLWQVVDESPEILSATITGSFVRQAELADVGDIDLVLVAERMSGRSFADLQTRFAAALRPILAAEGYELYVNATLGPLKFDGPGRAVLHLMLYTPERHADHALRSPFTCYDWQRSTCVRKRSLAEMFPVPTLQPSHFLSARRSPRDYLNDLSRREISYRTLEFGDDVADYRELPGRRPMQVRDEHEFALHVLKFLMQNFLKLVTRENREWDAGRLPGDFATYFPLRMAEHAAFYRELAERKRRRSVDPPLPEIVRRTERFVDDFEAQFRRRFADEATTHWFFRHGATAANRPTGDDAVFLGRAEVGLAADDLDQISAVAAALASSRIDRVYSSPRRRCLQTFELLAARVALPAPIIDPRLAEIDYGACEGMSVAAARAAFPELFAAWRRGEDARFPNGETAADVLRRVQSFIADAWTDGAATVTATHNVVLRALFGHLLQLPPSTWHRLRIPHATPFRVVQTCWGSFFDDEESKLRGLLDGLVADVAGEEHTPHEPRVVNAQAAKSGSALCR